MAQGIRGSGWEVKGLVLLVTKKRLYGTVKTLSILTLSIQMYRFERSVQWKRIKGMKWLLSRMT